MATAAPSGTSARTTVAIVASLCIAAAITVIVLRSLTSSTAPPAEQPHLQARLGPHDWQSAIERIDLQLPALEKMSRERPAEWPLAEQVAVLSLARVRLSGDFADLERAAAALRRAFAVAPPGTGPHLTAAQLAMATHRIGEAEAMLEAIDLYAVPADGGTAAEVLAMRGDIAYYRGRTDEARRLYAAAAARGAGGGFRLAVLEASTGAPAKADARYQTLARAPRSISSQMLWSIALQRAAIALQKGDWEAASALIDTAERSFKGHWLTAAYRAQMQALDGDLDGSARAYEAILKSHPSPDVMSGLAAVEQARGNTAASRRWNEAASLIWEDRIRRLPEAAQLHASEHFLAVGDVGRALDLARREVRNRPFGDGYVNLANAFNAERRPESALEALGRAKATGWRSPDLYTAAMRSFEMLGQVDKAGAAKRIALELNPLEFDPRDSLIAFGH